MKKIKVFWNGKRLKDVYPHATRWQVFKFRIIKLVRTYIQASLIVATIYAVFLIGQYYGDTNIYTNKIEAMEMLKDTLSVKIEELQNEVLDDLRNCESQGYNEDDGIIIFDSNNKASIGQWQYQKDTVIHYYKTLYGKDITRKESVLIALDDDKARQLTKDIIFTTDNGYRNWLNCSNKLGLKNRVEIIKSLAE